MKKLNVLVMLLALAAARVAAAQPARAAGIPAEEYVQRRAALMQKCGEGVVILESGTLIPGEAGIDRNSPLYDFTYFTGVQPDRAVLVLVPGEKMEFLFVRSDVEKFREETGVKLVLDEERFPAFIVDVLPAAERIYLKDRSPLRRAILEANDDAEYPKGLGKITSAMRQVKSPAELECLRLAAKATCAGHRAAFKGCEPKMNEKTLEKLIEKAFYDAGGTSLGFPPIVGSGRNGTILHYMRNSSEMEEGTLVVMDVGAAYQGYSADVTRTIPVGGKFTEKQRRAYQCVLEAQRAAEKALKAGATWEDLDSAAKKVFEKYELTRWSYAHSSDRSVRHGLGHHIGLSVHDVGSYWVKFQPGMVITIEPGYYDKDEEFGIRIEDNYIVTEDGFERISKWAPREIEEIEKAMAGE